MFTFFFVLPITALWHSNEKDLKKRNKACRVLVAFHSTALHLHFKIHMCGAERSVQMALYVPFLHFTVLLFHNFSMCKIELFDCCTCVLHLLQCSAHDTL